MEDILSGHSASTLRCVETARASNDAVLEPLRAMLALEKHPAQRNAALRRWLQVHRGDAEALSALGLASAEPPPRAQSVVAPEDVTGLAVFDFDCTLSVRDVGHFDAPSTRVFGGEARVATLREMLAACARASPSPSLLATAGTPQRRRSMRSASFSRPFAGSRISRTPRPSPPSSESSRRVCWAVVLRLRCFSWMTPPPTSATSPRKARRARRRSKRNATGSTQRSAPWSRNGRARACGK